MSDIQGNASTPLTRSVGRGSGRGMVLQFVSPVQGGWWSRDGGEQVLAEASSVSGDGIPSQSHHTEPTPSIQVTVTPTQNPIPPSADVVSQMSDIIKHVGQQLANTEHA